MQVTRDLPDTMLDNAGAFTHAFFRRFTLRKAPRPIALTETVVKDYVFPTFYHDVTCAQAVFLCAYAKAAQLMAGQLGPRIKPVRMPRGHMIWGLPKRTEEIDIRREGGDCITTARGENGAPYLTLRIPMTGAPTPFDVSSYLYTRLNGRLLRSLTNFTASFRVTKHMRPLLRKDLVPDRTYIVLGGTSFAPMLRALEIEPHPFQFRYAEHMSSCFDLPQEPLPAWAAMP